MNIIATFNSNRVKLEKLLFMIVYISSFSCLDDNYSSHINTILLLLLYIHYAGYSLLLIFCHEKKM